MRLGREVCAFYLGLLLLTGLLPAVATPALAASTLDDEELRFEAENPLPPKEIIYEKKAAEPYDPNARYAQPSVPSPAMADLLDRIFRTYKSEADFKQDRAVYNSWASAMPVMVDRFDRDPSRYVDLQRDMLGLRREACNFTVTVVQQAARNVNWLSGDVPRGTRVTVPSRAADYDNRTRIDYVAPREVKNVFNGVPFIGASTSFMRFMKIEFLDHLVETMNHRHLNFLPLHFVVNREPLRPGRPGHVFLVTGIKRTGKTTGRSSFQLQLREGSLDEFYWRPRTRDAQLDVFINSPQRFNLLIPTQAFAEFYADEMETRFVIQENRERARRRSESGSAPASIGFEPSASWFTPILR